MSADLRAPGSRPPALLSVTDLAVNYSDGARAVDGLSFMLGRGEIVALLGPNGAGKTTTLRAISGFLPGDRAKLASGRIVLDGVSVEGSAPHRNARRGVAMVSERDKVFGTLTVEQNLTIGAQANPRRGDVASLRAAVFELFPVLRERREQAAGYLSGGERQMLAIGRALVSGPTLLMVDELSLGLAPRIVSGLIDVLRVLRRDKGLSILLVEQSAHVAFEIADYVHVLSVGRSVLEGDAASLRARSDFMDSYLGLAGQAGP